VIKAMSKAVFMVGKANVRQSIWSDVGVARKNLSPEDQPYAPQGHFLKGAAVKFLARLDLDPICLFLDGHK
jgi:hypothetical protein